MITRVILCLLPHIYMNIDASSHVAGQNMFCQAFWYLLPHIHKSMQA